MYGLQVRVSILFGLGRGILVLLIHFVSYVCPPVEYVQLTADNRLFVCTSESHIDLKPVLHLYVRIPVNFLSHIPLLEFAYPIISTPYG